MHRLRVQVDGEERFDIMIEASETAGEGSLFLDTALDLGSGDVRLVTRNEDTGALEIARPKS